MNGLNSFDKTDKEYLLASTDGLFGFWMSKVKVIAGLGMWWRRHRCRRWSVEVQLI